MYVKYLRELMVVEKILPAIFPGGHFVWHQLQTQFLSSNFTEQPGTHRGFQGNG